MTMTTPRPSAGASIIQWTRVQAALWVGKLNGEFAGMIETLPNGLFQASTNPAQSLGTFDNIDAAKASFRR